MSKIIYFFSFSGSIDQFEFLFWFDLKASLELVNANNGILLLI